MAAREERAVALPAGGSAAYWPSPLAARLFDLAADAFVYARTLAVFALIWHGAALWIANPVLLPTPIDVGRAFWELVAAGEVAENALVSLVRLAVSFGLALAVGVPLGFVMGLNRAAFEILDPVIELLRPISGIAWIPLGMFVLGVGEELPTAIMFYGAFFPIVINTIVGVRAVSPPLVHAAQVLGVGRAAIVRQVVWPAALPNVLVGARLGAGSAWMAMVAAELIGAPSGLGFAIEWYRELLMTPKVFAFLIVIGVLGYLFDRGLRALQRRLTPWAADGTAP